MPVYLIVWPLPLWNLELPFGLVVFGLNFITCTCFGPCHLYVTPPTGTWGDFPSGWKLARTNWGENGMEKQFKKTNKLAEHFKAAFILFGLCLCTALFNTDHSFHQGLNLETEITIAKWWLCVPQTFLLPWMYLVKIYLWPHPNIMAEGFKNIIVHNAIYEVHGHSWDSPKSFINPPPWFTEGLGIFLLM